MNRKLSFLIAFLIAFCCIVSFSYAENWTCPNCGNNASGNFCNECGSARPVAEADHAEQGEIDNDGKTKEFKEDIVFKQDEYYLTVGSSTSIMAIVKTKGNNALQWSSSDEEVVQVSDTGEIKGISAGEALITVRLIENTGVEKTCRVVVVDQIKKVAFTEKKIDLAVDLSAQLTIKTEPENMPNNALEWTSSNEKVAIVNNDGVVTGVSIGSARITAASADNKKVKATITVNVDKYDIVFTELSSREETLLTTTSGGEKIKVSTKNKCVDVQMTGIGTTMTPTGFYHMTTFTITPIKAGADTITFKFGNRKTYKVYVSPSVFMPKESVEDQEDSGVDNQDGETGNGYGESKEMNDNQTEDLNSGAIQFFDLPWGLTYDEAYEKLQENGIEVTEPNSIGWSSVRQASLDKVRLNKQKANGVTYCYSTPSNGRYDQSGRLYMVFCDFNKKLSIKKWREYFTSVLGEPSKKGTKECVWVKGKTSVTITVTSDKIKVRYYCEGIEP